MGWSSRVRASILRVVFTLLVVSTAAACSGGSPEADAAGTSGAGPFLIGIEQTYITVENRTGAPLAGGQLEIIPAGVLPPFKSTLPRLENGAKRDVMLNSFRASDGTLFNRGIVRARRVKVTAKDVNGGVHEQEVPFE